MKVTKDLTQGNIYKNFLLYTLPLIFSALLSSAYSTVDAVIAGKFISEHALGAINATGSYDTVFYTLFSGFGTGFSVYVSLLFGKKDFACMKRDIVQMLTFLTGVILLVSAGSIALCEPILDYLRVDPVLRADAKTYFIIYTSGYVLTYLNLVLMQILQALGVTSFSLYVSTASAVLNIGGNLLTVIAFGWGVAGLAVSTLLSTAGATVFYLVMLCRAFRELPCEKVSYRFRFSCVTRSLRYTLPAAVQQVAYHGIGLLIAPAINGLGANATTGNTVATRLNNMCSQSFWCATRALSCYTAQCVGAGKEKRIRKGLWADLWVCVGFLLPFLLVFVGFAEPISSLFFPAGYTGEAYQYAVRFATFYLPFLLVNMLGHLIHAYLRGLGSMRVVFWLSVLGSAVRYVCTLLLVPTMHMEGVFLAMSVGWCADTLASSIIYLLFYRTNDHILRAIQRAMK